MRSPWLFLAALAAPLVFTSPAPAAILPSCCVNEAGTPSGDRDPDQDSPPFLVPAQVRRPDERALEATAEAPISVEVPVVDAIGVPLEERPGVSEPAFVPSPVVVEPPPIRIDAVAAPVPGLIIGPPCCQVQGETHQPDPRDPEEKPPVLIGAETKRGDERALEAAAEAPIPAPAQRVDAIGVPLEEQRGVSAPAHVPASADNRPAWLRILPANAELILALFAILLATGFGLSRHRRQRQIDLEPLAVPASLPQLPEELTRHLVTPVPLFAPAVEAAPASEREPA